MMGKAEGLGALQMGVAGNQGFDVLLCQSQQHGLKLTQLRPNRLNLRSQIKAGIGADLVVARSRRMQLFTHIAHQLG